MRFFFAIFLTIISGCDSSGDFKNFGARDIRSYHNMVVVGKQGDKTVREGGAYFLQNNRTKELEFVPVEYKYIDVFKIGDTIP